MDKIYRALLDFGVPSNLSGFRYLHDSIQLTIEQNSLPFRGNITNELYPAVAEMNGTEWRNVERNMRHAIERAFCVAKDEDIKKYFGNCAHGWSGRPTNAEFIFSFALVLSDV